ncbi:MAG: hypothetical protein ACLSA6_04485 [Holdemania massiliensis]
MLRFQRQRQCGGCGGIHRSYVLDYPIIPKYVTVHLGRPTASAQNVTVTFKDYIKNAASSEIYPTWPEQVCVPISIANSLCLNRCIRNGTAAGVIR